jgi:hypothetical protein
MTDVSGVLDCFVVVVVVVVLFCFDVTDRQTDSITVQHSYINHIRTFLSR